MKASLAAWWRLDRTQQRAVGAAVDNGERMDDPQLRPIAVALSRALLENNGWRLLRRPAYLIMFALSFAALIAFGLWRLLIVDVALALACFWLVERQARRLRPQWRRALEANTDVPDS